MKTIYVRQINLEIANQLTAAGYKIVLKDRILISVVGGKYILNKSLYEGGKYVVGKSGIRIRG